jgi:hypothetical protein
MSFSATDWRNRMSYYDNTYASLNFSWSNLGAAQGNRKYFTFTFDASYGTTGALGMGYLSCTFYSFAPCVEAMNQYVYWQITYTYYLNTYNYTTSGDYDSGYLCGKYR